MKYQYAKCAKVKHREEMSASRTYTLEEWMEDKYNYDKLCDYLMIPGSSDASDLADTLVCNCCMCVLSSQPDFVAQKSWLEEVYSDYNNVYGTAHKCIFLPKFHPELNPIERVWSMMKRHCRQCSNGSMERLSQSMSYALSSDCISVSTVRRICRLVSCYLSAYAQGMDIVEAESWMKKRKCHRGYSPEMDETLRQIYFPLGLPVPMSREDENSVEIDENGERVDENWPS